MSKNPFESKERLESLQSLDLMDSSPEKEYDAITELAAIICDCPIALISLVDEKRQFFKSHHGLDIDQTPIEVSFCAKAIQSEKDIFMVNDAREETAFCANPLVTGIPNIVFYAGVPLTGPKGETVGTLSVIDRKPRKLDDRLKKALKSLANQVIQLFELRKSKKMLLETQMEFKTEAMRLHNVIEATRVGTWEWHIQTGEVIINERWAEIGGYTLEELQPIEEGTWFKLIHPEDMDISRSIIQDCFEKKIDYYDIECRMLHKDGHIVWINDRGKIISWSEDGKPLIMSGTHTDITEKKKIELDLAKALGDLSERVKEQSCLYQIANLSSQRLSVERLLTHAVEILPTGFQFEEEISVAIAYRGQEFTSPHHKASKQTLVSRKMDLDGNELYIVVTYHSQKPLMDEGPFLKEERQLLDTVTDNLILNINQILTGESLEQNEKRFRTLVENSADSFAILGLDGIAKYVSPSITKTLGYTEEEALDLQLFEIIHPEDREKVAETLNRALENPGIPFTQNVSRTLHKDGTWLWIEATITNMFHDPVINGLVDNFRDITDQVLYREAIQRSNERYEYVNKVTNDAIYDWDIVQDVFEWGEGFFRIFDFNKKEEPFRLSDWADMMDFSDREKNKPTWNEFLEDPGQYRWHKEFRIRKGDGSIAFVEEMGHLIRDEDGAPIRMIGVLRDVTDNKELQNLLDNATSVAKLGGWEVDQVTGKLFISKITREIQELTEEYEPDLESAINFYKEGKSRETIRQKVKEAIEHGKPFDLELEIVTAKGKERWVRAIGNADFEEGRCVRLFGSLQDIHRRKSAEEARKRLNAELKKHAHDLEISNRELEQFAYVASHDLQEPLRMITSFLAQLEKKYGTELDERAIQYISFAVDGAKRMRQIILDLLEFSRVGKISEESVKVDLQGIVKEVCMLHSQIIEEKGAKVIYGDLPSIMAHKGPVLQIFQNLVGNALKYSKDDVIPEITINAIKRKHEWLVSISDNGIGISPEFHDKIFIIFQRLHGKEKYSGTGMGLAIVKKIVDNLGGKIWVESEEGKGSTFHIAFPSLA
ncbi:PAS domain-containing protein [Aquiflexum sp.]|uniref:PAS domain-containing protein n=1 Tax=Aquiflexum sp. TaxID=1872584 RepID=UPI00359417D7